MMVAGLELSRTTSYPSALRQGGQGKEAEAAGSERPAIQKPQCLALGPSALWRGLTELVRSGVPAIVLLQDSMGSLWHWAAPLAKARGLEQGKCSTTPLPDVASQSAPPPHTRPHACRRAHFKALHAWVPE